jgi:hypothetical protein
MKQIELTIRGVSPLLMHRFPMEPIEAIEKKTPLEQARIALYEEKGKPVVPGINLQRCLVAAAAYSKGKGRGSLAKFASAALFIVEGNIALNGKTTPWVVDSRPVVVPATRGRVVRHRPRFDTWECACVIEYDENLLTENQVRRIVDDAGQKVGLLDYRPEKKGPFGRFVVTSWQPT